MESEVKSEILEQDEVQNLTEEEPETDGDGMQTVEPDRLGNTDNTDYVYDVDSDVSADSNYADHFNAKTGKNERVSDSYGKLISTYSDSTKAERTKWLNKKYEPKPAIAKAPNDPAPKLEELVTVGTGKVAKYVHGTPENPNYINKVVPNSLFIDGKADQNDIRQGTVGDCYFLAALFQVIHYDPNFLPSIMKNYGDEVYVELCHREGDKENGYKWVRKPIAVKWGVNQRGTKSSLYLSHVGSHYRLKYDPEPEVKWSANFEGDMLKISKVQYYQAAMWVQCMERAYADYSKLYGHYGTGNGGTNSKKVSYKDGDRYDNITGGSGWHNLQMLYGDDVVNPNQLMDIRTDDESETTSLLDASGGMLESLATLSQLQDGSQAEQIHMTTWAYQYRLWPRVTYYAESLKKSVEEFVGKLPEGVDPAEYNAAIEALNAIVRDISAFRAMKADDPEFQNAGQKAFSTTADSLIQLEANASFLDLGLKDYNSLRAASGSLLEGSSGIRYLIQDHEYNIREMHFVDKDGNLIDVNTLYAYYVDGVLDENYDPNAEKEEEEPEVEEKEEKRTFWQKLFGKKGKKDNQSKDPKTPKVEPKVEFKLNLDKLKDVIDLDKSYAVIQNPHAQSKAKYAGQTEAQNAVGTWTTSLRELFAGTVGYTAVIIKKGDHSATGTADVKATNGIGGASTENNPEVKPA